MIIKRRTERRGLSILEILAGFVVLGIIAAIVIPRISDSGGSASHQAHELNRAAINAAVERYYINESEWPEEDLSDIGKDVNYFPEGLPTNPLTGEAYVLDPQTHRVK